MVLHLLLPLSVFSLGVALSNVIEMKLFLVVHHYLINLQSALLYIFLPNQSVKQKAGCIKRVSAFKNTSCVEVFFLKSCVFFKFVEGEFLI